MNSTELKKWLRDNSSGIYRPSRDAADYIERLEAAVKTLLDASWNGPIDADHPAREKACAVLANK